MKRSPRPQREEQVTDRIIMSTGLLNHKLVTQLAFMGERLGLEITHKHDGGWLTRQHLLTVTGTARVVRVFDDYVTRVVEAMRETSP